MIGQLFELFERPSYNRLYLQITLVKQLHVIFDLKDATRKGTGTQMAKKQSKQGKVDVQDARFQASTVHRVDQILCKV